MDTWTENDKLIWNTFPIYLAYLWKLNKVQKEELIKRHEERKKPWDA